MAQAFDSLAPATQRVPLDKSEGGVKDKNILSVFLAPFFWRVAQAFDLGGTADIVGAPSFALFAKGGSRKCLWPAIGRVCRMLK